MRPRFHVFLSALMLSALAACSSLSSRSAAPTPVPRGPEVRGVFAGMTPCGAQARPLLQIPVDADCDQMIWSLILYQDPQTGVPTTYSLKSAYGISKQGTNDLIGGGTVIMRDGTWTTTTGTRTDPEATVYELNPGDSQRKVSFLKVNDDLLHVLNREKALLVGNGAWSYTLNRIDDQSQVDEPTGSQPDLPTRPPLPPQPKGSSVFGVFDGRTPCHAIMLELAKIEPSPGCLKIKGRLTLYKDKATGTPSTYLFMGTSAFREGSWKIIQGLDKDPNAVVYQLDLDNVSQPVSFLQVDENDLFLLDGEMNLLVGNALFSYTFSRTTDAQ